MTVFSRFVRYFDEVSRRKSIRAAAERLNIASSAIDRQILKVEEELGVPLFERLPQGMRLTAAGEHLVYHVRRWQKEFEHVKAQIEDLGGLQGGRIVLATSEALVGDLLAEPLASFRQQYPRVSVTVRVAGSAVRDLVLAGDADIGLTFTSTANRALRVERSLALRFGAVVPPGHPLAKRSQVSLRDCSGYPMIIPDDTVLLREFINTSFARIGIDLRPSIVSNNFTLMKSLVAKGAGVALLTRVEVLPDIVAGRLVFLKLSDKNIPPSFLSLVTTAHPSVSASQLCQWLARTMENIE